MFSKKTDLSKFFGEKLYIEGETFIGELFASFGKSGKIRVKFKENLSSMGEKLKGKKVFIKIKRIHKLKHWNGFSINLIIL